MTNPPSGTVTFLFTDIEGSTTRWEHQPRAMREALARHDAHLRELIDAHGGYIFKTVGDAFCAAFASPGDALQAALAAQQALNAEEWSGEIGELRVRMALHTGMAEERDGDYFGQPLNRVARLLSAGHGGQVLLSLATQELVRDALPRGTSLRGLGEHRLKDLIRPERVYQLLAPNLPADFPPLNTLDNRPNNLPAQPTLFIGREKEMGDIVERLRRPDVRLLTLTGPGGTGKTRLALQAAADLVDDFEHGVYFVNLAPVSDSGLVVPTIAQTLGVREAPGQPLSQTLQDYLRDRQMLLLLDNFEQVIGAAPQLNELLSASRLKVLVTSRMLLHLYGERDYAVPPLSLPDPGHLPPLEGLNQYEAVRLFIERAQAARADFQVTNENAPAVAEICARLDGLPLAIELAAARIRLLSPQAILSRLQSRLQLLTGGARDLPARQQTLRNAIEWSYDLLGEGEKQLFKRLAVFVGGGTLEAIEAICDAGGNLKMDALSGVSSLVDKSLIRQEDAAGGEPRFVMLETIHEYAREKLRESGEEKELLERHAEYFVAFADEDAPGIRGASGLKWFEPLEEEHDNLRAALAWAEQTDGQTMLRLAVRLYVFWLVRGDMSEGRAWLSRALGHKQAQAKTELRVDALRFATALARQQGDVQFHLHLVTQALEVARELGYKVGMVDSLVELSWAALRRGDPILARSYTDEALVIAQESGDHVMTNHIRDSTLGLLMEERNYPAARSLVEERLLAARRSEHESKVADLLCWLGEIQRLEGNYQKAGRSYQEGLSLTRSAGNKLIEGYVLGNLAYVAIHKKRMSEAEGYAREAMSIARQMQKRDMIALCLLAHAGIASSLGKEKAPRAARLLAAAEAVRKSEGFAQFGSSDRVEFENYKTLAHAHLSGEEWDEAWFEGQAMTMEQAIAYALSEAGGD